MEVGFQVISDRDISATTVTATAFWAVGGILVVIGGFFDLWFTGAGLWLSGVGGCLSVRRMMCRQAHREMRAFEFGRQLEREANGLRSV